MVYGVLAVGVASVSTGALLGRLALDQGVPPLAVAAYRLGLASLLLAPVALARRDSFLPLNDHYDRWAVASGAALAAHFALWIGSLERTTVASSVALVTAHPILVAAAAPVVLHERGRPALLAGIVTAMAGVAVVALGDGRHGHHALVGDVMALGGAVAFAVYVMAGRRARARLPLIQYVAIVYPVASLLLFGAMAISDVPMGGYSPRAWLWFSLMALVPQLAGHSSFNWALQHVSASYVSVVVLGEIAGSALLAWAFLGEAPPATAAVGAAMITSGLVMASVAERHSVS